ncbi:urease accessory protein UreD [Isoptericola variabilis]|uniref:Urease accessory protein UreH-like protein n=1 Tax=Isoptericola variabilis (strain 225) TaxID=743718 RepID=F6FR32_ISOV2|nr:urease accessory protein UreD [Isoptericola variabilis]AEG44982.1 urease accessory protein UreH-like protein [Isoptericola variabilis 225]TWH26006.1 urease accessory protein [Isoptericola variabilis J7]
MTRIAVAPAPGRSVLRVRSDRLAVRVLHQDQDGARVALVANGALLLAGDAVEIEVDVAEGAWLEIVETTGTVAYGGAAASRWDVDVRLGEAATLVWDALPFVVSDGARTHRRTDVHLGESARALLRETFVLGRARQAGGDLWTHSLVQDAGGPLHVEELDLSGQVRGLPGVLAVHGSPGLVDGGPAASIRAPRTLSVLDTVLALGWRPAAVPGTPPAPATSTGQDASATCFELDRPGTVLRWLGTELHEDTIGDRYLALWERELTDERRRTGASVGPASPALVPVPA